MTPATTWMKCEVVRLSEISISWTQKTNAPWFHLDETLGVRRTGRKWDRECLGLGEEK